MTKVVSLDRFEGITFDDGSSLFSEHFQDCCESHYLDFSGLSLPDFKGLDFDLSSPTFFEKVPDFGVRLIPTNGHPVSIPGYGYNNGYYSDNLTLVLARPGKPEQRFDIYDCQDVKGY